MTKTIQNKMVRFAGKSILIILFSSGVLYGALHCSLISSERRTPQEEKSDKQNPIYTSYSEKLFSETGLSQAKSGQTEDCKSGS